MAGGPNSSLTVGRRIQFLITAKPSLPLHRAAWLSSCHDSRLNPYPPHPEQVIQDQEQEEAAKTFMKVIHGYFNHIKSESLTPGPLKGRGISNYLLEDGVSRNLWMYFKTSKRLYSSTSLIINCYLIISKLISYSLFQDDNMIEVEMLSGGNSITRTEITILLLSVISKYFENDSLTILPIFWILLIFWIFLFC